MVVINMINMLSVLEFLFGRPSYDIDNSVKTIMNFCLCGRVMILINQSKQTCVHGLS